MRPHVPSVLHLRSTRTATRRLKSLALGLALAAALLPALPASVAQADQSPTLVVLPPETPPPPLPDSARDQLPAPVPDQGIDDPPVTDLTLTGTPDQILAGLTPDPAASGQNFNVYQINGADHLADLFSSPVNVQDSQGHWVPRTVPDIIVIPGDPGGGSGSGPGGWSGTNGTCTFNFPKVLSQATPITADTPDGSLSFAPEGIVATATTPTGAAITYIGAGVSFTYTVTGEGLLEDISLSSITSPPVIGFDITATGLTLRQEPSAEISILSSGQVVASIPTAVVRDSFVDPSSGLGHETTATYTLTDSGAGTYRLQVSVDPVFLTTATYPVTVDPPTWWHGLSRWGYTDSAHPGTSYEGESYLDVGNPSSSDARNAYMFVGLGNLPQANRVVQWAMLDLYATSVAKSSVGVANKRVNQPWPSSLTWNNQPDTDASPVTWYPKSGDTAGAGWFYFDETGVYRPIVDTTTHTPNDGFRLNGNGSASPITDNFHEFYSPNSGGVNNGQPQLVIAYDDPPSAPTLQSPDDGITITTSSPVLTVTNPVPDPNGDPVYVNYQVSTSSTDFSSAKLVASSGWVPDQTSWPVPAGSLLDGQTYYWRAQSWDMCDNQTQSMCDLAGKPNPVSSVRSFSVTLSHLGDDSRWSMWSDSLGNAMTAKVNEATGNLYVDYPLDSLATPVGPLNLSLTYNSHDTVDAGLGKGWTVSAGAGSDPSQLPVKLTEVSYGTGSSGAQIKLADGGKLFFPKVIGSGGVGFYESTGANDGSVKKNRDGTWQYTTSAGGTFTFDASGALTGASPSTSTALKPGFSYTYKQYNGLSLLTSVKDPWDRTVTFSYGTGTPYDAGQLVGIGTWDGRSWQIGYDSGRRISSVSDPENEVVGFAYDTTLAPPRMNQITDGVGRHTHISYTTPPAPATQPQVASVLDAGDTDATTFVYNGAYTGQVDNWTAVTDPRGNASGADANSYQTQVQFDRAGLPIQILGPANTLGHWPITTMAWDKNGNLACKRGPAANAVAKSCFEDPTQNVTGLWPTCRPTTPTPPTPPTASSPRPARPRTGTGRGHARSPLTPTTAPPPCPGCCRTTSPAVSCRTCRRLSWSGGSTRTSPRAATLRASPRARRGGRSGGPG